jgi:hypothetical protein
MSSTSRVNCGTPMQVWKTYKTGMLGLNATDYLLIYLSEFLL